MDEIPTPVLQSDPLLDLDDPEFRFWLRHARRSQEPVVALNAGTGREVLPLAAQDIRLLAIEADERLRALGEARTEEQGVEVAWRSGTAETFEAGRKAGMIFLPRATFQRLLALASQRAALQRIHDALQIGGKLALDLPVPDHRLLAEAQVEGGSPAHLEPEALLPAMEGRVFTLASRRYDPLAQHLHLHRVHERINGEGVSELRWHTFETLAVIWPREMQLLLESSGFEIEALFSGWNDEPFERGATRQVWVARKAI